MLKKRILLALLLSLPSQAETDEDSSDLAIQWRDQLLRKQEISPPPTCSGTACDNSDYRYRIPCVSIHNKLSTLTAKSDTTKDDFFLLRYKVASVELRHNDYTYMRGFENNLVVSIYTIIDDTGVSFDLLHPGGQLDDRGFDALCENAALPIVGHEYAALLREEAGVFILIDDSTIVDVTPLEDQTCSPEDIQIERGI